MDENDEVKDEAIDTEGYDVGESSDGGGWLGYVIAGLFGGILVGFGKKIVGGVKSLFSKLFGKHYTNASKKKDSDDDED